MPLFDSSYFKKLKEIIKVHININNLINIQNIHINNNYSSKPLEYDEDTKRLSLNNKKFSPTERTKIREILREAENEGATLLLKESEERVKDIKLKEESADVSSLLRFFKDKVPPNDFNALRGAIYVDKLAREGKKFEEVYHLKGEIGRKFGGRGLKICNLYASGYFETMIKPLYEEFSQHGFFDRKNFLNKYNTIINEEAFAVFVRGDMDSMEVKNTIKTKMQRNLKYGRRNVTIHGIGRSNAEKIREAITAIEREEEYPNIEKYIEEMGSIILVKLMF